MNNLTTKDFAGKLRDVFMEHGLTAVVGIREGALVLSWEVANLGNELHKAKMLIADLAYKLGFEHHFANPGPAALNEISGKYEKEFIVRPIAE